MKKAARPKFSKSQPPPGKPVAVPTPVVTNTGILRLAGLICALVAFMLYANTLGNDYTVDDGTVISNNSITKKGISAIPEIFSSSYRAGFWDRNEGLYRPLSVAMFAIEWELAPENPAPGHWINVILYAVTAYLLFFTLAGMFKKYSILLPFVTTLLFVVHPIHTEVVANIKSRDEILCLLFSLAAIFHLNKFNNTGKSLQLAVALGAYFLAFLSKESAITLLGIIPLTMWFFTEIPLKKILTRTAPFLGVAITYIIIRYLVLGEIKGSPQLQLVNNSLLAAETFSVQLATAVSIMGRYLYLLIIPCPLSFDYSYNQIPLAGWGDSITLISVLVLAGMIYLAIRGLREKSPASYGILFFFITISLVSNFVFLIESTMAERFLYMPSLGFILAVVFYGLKMFRLTHPVHMKRISDLWKMKPVFAALVAMILILYSYRTISRNTDWKNNLTLLETDVKTSPNSARIRYAYGSALLIEKALKEENPAAKEAYLNGSITQLEKGVSILPNYAEAWNHLGIAYKEKENYPAAVNAFEKARSYKEFKDAEFYISAGLAYGMDKKYVKAVTDFTRAIEIDPGNAEAYNNKGLYLFEGGDSDSSLFYFDKAIAMKDSFYQAYYNKGNTLAKAGLFNEAIQLYETALKYKPGYVDAWLNMGNSYAAMKNFSKALEIFQKVEATEPNNRKVLINIGVTYRFLGDEKKANEYFEKADKLNPAK